MSDVFRNMVWHGQIARGAVEAPERQLAPLHGAVRAGQRDDPLKFGAHQANAAARDGVVVDEAVDWALCMRSWMEAKPDSSVSE